MTTIINANTSAGLTQTADTSGIVKLQSNGVTTNALAWVNFNGSGGTTIRASYNVSSITRASSGVYTVNFTNAMSDANYVAVGTAVTTGQYAQILCSYNDNKTTTSSLLNTTNYGGGASWVDASTINVAFFGN